MWTADCGKSRWGYRQGGPAGFGLRRVLIDQGGSIKSELSRGEHKSLQTDRVILMPGPDAEVTTVNQIYRWFIDEGIPESEIAARLNDKGVRTDLDRNWTRATVREVLATDNITVAYATALLAATPANMLISEEKPKKIRGVTPEQMAIMEREMSNVEGQFKLLEHSYGQDILNLVLVKGYLARLTGNEAVIRFLTQNHPDFLREFASIVNTTAIDKQI